jgi:hypothetical protein
MCSQVGRAVRLWNLRTTDQLIHDLVEGVEDTVAMLSRSGINTTIENALLARALQGVGKGEAMTREEKLAAFTEMSKLPGIKTSREFEHSLACTEPKEVGDRVVWTIDAEPGTIVALNDSAIAIRWDETGI